MPNLTTYFNSQGEAIAFTKGNLGNLTSEYEKYIQQQAKEFLVNGDENGNTVQDVINNYNNNKELGFWETLGNSFKNIFGNYDSDDLPAEELISSFEDIFNKSQQEVADYLNDIDIGGNTGERLETPKNYAKEVLEKLLGFSPEEISKMSDEDFNELQLSIAANIESLQTNIDTDMSKINTILLQSAYSKDSFWQIDDESIRTSITTMLSSINSDVWNELDLKTPIEIQTFINKIINAMSENKEGFADAWDNLFKLDSTKLSANEYTAKVQEYMNTIGNILRLNEEGKKQFIISLGLDIPETLVNNVKNKINDEFDDKVIELTVEDLKIAAEKIEVPENTLLSWDELTDKIKEAKRISYSYNTSDIFSLKTTNGKNTNLGKLSEEIDTIQSAYSTLSSAIAEYNSQNSFSIDTMQSVIALGDNWLDYLVDENGALKLDEQALENLTKARIEDMKQQALTTLASNVSGIQSEADANNYLASTNYNAATSYQALTQAKIEDVEATLKSKVENGDISTDTYDKIIEKFKSDADKIQKLFDSTDFTFSSDGISQSSIESLENHANILKSVKDEYEDTGRISSSTLSSIAKAYPQMGNALRQYREGLISEEELFGELENCYENDKDNYLKSLIKKSETDEVFFNALKTNYPALFNQLAQNCYGIDVKNWTSMEQAKYNITTSLQAKLNEKWQEYFDGVDNTFNAYGKIIENADGSGYTFMGSQEDSFDYDHTMTEDEWQEKNTDIQRWNSYRKYGIEIADWGTNALSGLKDSAYDFLSSNIDLSYNGLSGSSNSSDAPTSKSYNLIERAIDKVERKISDLRDKADDTFSSWAERNSAVAEQMSAITEEISLQQQAYKKYMELADSAGLDDYYKNLIINGDIDIIEVDDEELQKQIDAFQEYYDKAMECNESVQGLQSNFKELARTDFDNITEQFDELTENISHAISILNGYIDLADAKNNFAAEEIYIKLIEQQEKNTETLYKKLEQQTQKLAQMRRQGIKEDSEEYIKAEQQIYNTYKGILDSTIDAQSAKNDLQNLKFDKFDWVEDKISNITGEADFYINYIENSGKDLIDKNGNFTDEGITTIGLHAQNVNTYLTQADDYAKKIKEIQELLANDPTNTSLMEQYDKYSKLHNEMVLSAQEERNAVADLVKNAYEKQVEALGNLIDRYKDLLSVSKDAHDYEKSMSEKASELDSLNKQYMAWKNDDSETGMKKRQELEKQINDAKDDIEETQYEKMISDAEKLLDDLQAEYESLVDEEVSKICSNLDNITQAVNSNAETIKSVLGEISTDTGLPLTKAMQDIWNNAKPVSDIDGTVATVGDNLSGTDGAITKVKEKAEKILSLMEENFNKNVKDTDDGSYNPDNAPDTTPDTPALDNASPNEPGNSSDKDSGSVHWIEKQDGFNKNWLNTETSIIDRLKYYDFDSSKPARAQYYEEMGGEGTYSGDGDQNIFMLRWMNEHGYTGYAKGTKSAAKGLHWFDEEGLGSEVLITKHGALRQFDSGDNVFDKESTKNLWNLAQIDTSKLIPNINLNTHFPEMVNRNANKNINYSCGDISFVLPNVKNYDDIMKQAQRDPKFEKMVQNMTVGQIMGKSSLSKLQF